MPNTTLSVQDSKKISHPLEVRSSYSILENYLWEVFERASNHLGFSSLIATTHFQGFSWWSFLPHIGLTSHNVLWGKTDGRPLLSFTDANTTSLVSEQAISLPWWEQGGWFHRELLWETLTSVVPFRIYPSKSPEDLDTRPGKGQTAAVLWWLHPWHPQPVNRDRWGSMVSGGSGVLAASRCLLPLPSPGLLTVKSQYWYLLLLAGCS